jgi:predicted CXXCH cytochrome family protein
VKRFAATAAGLALAVAFAAPASAQAGIAGSAHDFTNDPAGADSWNTSGEICAVCHTPHNANAAVLNTAGPLWDHEVNLAQTYTDYGAGYDMQSTTYNITGTSQLCLSCHDGQIALENFGGTTGIGTTIDAVNAAADLDVDLSDDHPVGMVYNLGEVTALELRDPATYVPVWGGTNTLDNYLGGGTTVECSSCHDVHNGSGEASLLHTANTGSVLCLSCHIK